ncbi:SRPBCC family protein [Micrococcaceae bacterium RIT802]|nr:SRPBCC family protein [Micrococcaceae bacterium RIT 802]
MDSNPYVVTRQRLVQAPPGAIFELLADPSGLQLIDASGPEKHARPDEPQRLGIGAEFGPERHVGRGRRMRNIVVEFEEARIIAWRDPQGHRWRYELVPAPRGTVVRETWDASRVRRHWPLKVRGVARRTPVDIEQTLDRLADYFDPAMPRPAAPEPTFASKRADQATALTPAQAAKREAERRARAEKAEQMDRAAAEALASKEQRAAHTAETRAARRVERAEQAVLARQAREARSVAKTEQAAQEVRARAEKAAAAERAKTEKAEQAAQLERAKAEKVAAAERAKAEQAAQLERAKAEKVAAAGRAKAEKAARVEAARVAKARKHEEHVPVEPLPPIGGTAGPLKSAPRRPAREAIAAAKAGRPAPPAPEPKPVAVAPKPKPKPRPQPSAAADTSTPIQDPVRTGLPPAAARRLRRAS